MGSRDAAPVMIETEDQFQYHDIQEGDFRLLTILPGLPHEAICCSQMTATLKDPPAYKTLSYAWGSPTRNHTVFVDNKKLLVTENLHTALLHLRNEQRALCIWIDAICINQQNLCERSQQVGMMRDIYKKSKRVYVWLGTPRTHARNLDDHDYFKLNREGRYDRRDRKRSFRFFGCKRIRTGFGHLERRRWRKSESKDLRADTRASESSPFGLIQHYADDKHFHELPGFKCIGKDRYSFTDNTTYKNLHKDLVWLLGAAWWTRLWCVQEILIAPDATIVHGAWQIPWRNLRLASMNQRRHAASCCAAALSQLPSKYWFFRDDEFVERSVGLEAKASYYDLDRLLRLYCRRKCQDPRDKIYGLLGLVDPAKYSSLRPDYTKDIPEVYYDATVAIHLQNPHSLRFLTGQRSSTVLDCIHLPSWVPDLSDSSDLELVWCAERRRQLYDLYHASAQTKADVKFLGKSQLQLRGVRIASIKKVGSVRSSLHYSDSISMIEQWSKFAGLDLSKSLESTQLPQQRKFWRTIIAAVVLDSLSEWRWRLATEDDMITYMLAMANFFGREPHDRPVFGFNYAKMMTIVTLGRTLFMTGDGKLGLCYSGAQLTDEVWVLHGSNVPFILRRVSPGGSYKLLGDCYLDGIMDGTTVTRLAGDARDIVLI